MGTNYYFHRNVCPHCKRSDEHLHIGKSSAGWCFSLHIYPEDGIRDLDDWLVLFDTPNSEIRDEYGQSITARDMIAQITERKHLHDANRVPLGYASWQQFYKSNYAEPGPNGLTRHVIGFFCAGHGKGTWDLIARDFS